MLFVLFAACIASIASAAAPPRVEVQHADSNRDGVDDTIITIRTTTPTGERRLVRTYSGVDGKLLGSYTLPRRLDRSPDFDGDGVITARDVAALLDAAVDPLKAGTGVDLTGDGVVSANDVAVLIRFIGDPPPQGPMMLIFGPTNDPEYLNPCGLTPSNGGLERAPCPDGPGGGPGGTGGGPDGLGTVEDEGGGGVGGGGDPPNDPPLCTVSIEPAPGHESLPRSIGVWTPDDGDNDDTNDTDDLPTVKAQGSDPLGTYSWMVVQGGDKVELLDAATGAVPDEMTTEIRIRGVLQSVQLNDVQIKVTHTTANGACSKDDMLELTAILATLTFNSTGNWTGFNPDDLPADGVNNTPQQALFGHPQLGAVSVGNPAGTAGHFTNIEITARLLPEIDNLPGTFDFKRDRQGFSGALLNNLFDPQPNANCPPPMWCNDDNTNTDEDVVIDPLPANTIFVEDSPGLGTNPADICFVDDELRLNIFRFREWLDVDGFRASCTLSWFSSASLFCAGCFYQVSDAYAPFGFGEGDFVLPPPPGAAPVVEEVDRNDEIDAALAGLKAHWSGDRMRAAGSIITIAERAQPLDARVREQLVGHLIDLARIRHEIYDSNSTPQLAIELLGRFGVHEAIPVLLDRLLDQFPRNIGSDRDLLPVAANALADIGGPAVGPILVRASAATDQEWWALQGALEQIDKKIPLVRQAMRTLLDAQTLLPAPANEEEKAERVIMDKRLNEFLKTPAPIRPKPASPLAQSVAPDLAGDAVGSTELH